ncbi:MAG: Eco57I restriction-modification methylase domain-containing protein [Flavobacteriaceae bacterium]
MPLFQKSVLNKFLKQQSTDVVSKAYKKFTKYFHNPIIQQNIREIKEEGFQQKFLMELFVNVFGYVINPDPNYNLTTEFKNEKGAKKADGAILVDGKALAVIELKGTKTKDLEKVRQQAFDYKANQSDCVYVITSNFEKLRFYINNAVEFEEFDLFTLTEQQFSLLYLCITKDNLLNNVPLKIKEASIQEEEKITKKFYSDYSLFKRELFRDLVKLNMKNDVFRAELNREDAEQVSKKIKLALFKKSQKLIDRFLFIFFAEDSTLLPSNSTKQILDKWKDDNDFGDERPLYNLFKQYFKFLDTGRKGTERRAEIFAYNGGLFKPDPILDSLLIDNDLLYKHTNTLQGYDFESQVDVNILGHIFENSLNEIESVNAEIEGGDFDKQKSKRKKDGVFYTPKYITKYIVDNTVGKLCEEKKATLKLKEEDFHPKRKKETKKKLLTLLENYREWLLQLTICDPACGSGAFLNQALDFLIKEHQYIDELQTKLLGGGFVFPNIENTILENNIYGVDINEESVEIAKLSLWLRTAQPRRKLNNLSSNIKCGNSLIDSKAVAGDKAFHWEEEFPQVFAKGGFDVIIGNPPYVRQELFKEIKPYLESKYKCYNSIADLYTYFIEKGINLMNNKGLFSFILPNKFLKASYGKQIRSVIKSEANLELLLDFDDFPVFADATTYPIIYVLNKKRDYKAKTFLYSEINKRDNIIDPINTLEVKKYNVNYSSLKDDNWIFIDEKINSVIKKINQGSISLKEFVDNKIFRGVSTGCNEVFIINQKIKDRLGNSNNIVKILMGKEVKRNTVDFQSIYLLFLPWDYDLESNENIKEYLLENKSKLEKRPEVKQGRFNWWCLSRYGSKNSHLLTEPKIIYPRINNQSNFFIDSKGEFSLSDNNFFISSDKKELLAILNSSLIFFFLKNISSTLQGGYYDFRRPFIEKIPIKVPNKNNQTNLVEKADKNLSLNNDYQLRISTFQKYFKSLFSFEKLTKKLQNWHDLSFKEFIVELNKAIKKEGGEKLSKLQELEWMDVFETKKAEAQALKAEIDKTDKEIDAMVYELYGLTEEEISIVENS